MAVSLLFTICHEYPALNNSCYQYELVIYTDSSKNSQLINRHQTGHNSAFTINAKPVNRFPLQPQSTPLTMLPSESYVYPKLWYNLINYTKCPHGNYVGRLDKNHIPEWTTKKNVGADIQEHREETFQRTTIPFLTSQSSCSRNTYKNTFRSQAWEHKFITLLNTNNQELNTDINFMAHCNQLQWLVISANLSTLHRW